MTRTANKDNYCLLAVTQSSTLAAPSLITELLGRSHIRSHNLSKMALCFAAACSEDIASSQLQTRKVTLFFRNGKAKMSVKHTLLTCKSCLKL